MKNERIIFAFSGQGSQYYQMGTVLFQQNDIFKEWMCRLDLVARDLIGESVVGIIYDRDKNIADPFERMLHSAPAIFMVQFAAAKVLMENDIHPHAVLGTSLGEFTAAAVAGAIAPEEALVAVIRQSMVFEKECREGGMLAILHDIKLYAEDELICKCSELSSVNFHSHFVISALKENLGKIKDRLLKQNIIFQELPVQYPFHSSFLEPVREPYLEYLKAITCGSPHIRFISCSDAGELTKINIDHFWNVARRRIVFSDTIRGLEAIGAYTYIDVGPMGTLANFINYNLADRSRSRVYAFITPFADDFQSMEKVEQYTRN